MPSQLAPNASTGYDTAPDDPQNQENKGNPGTLCHMYHSVDTLNKERMSMRSHLTLEDISEPPQYECPIGGTISQSEQLSSVYELDQLYEEPEDTSIYSNQSGPMWISRQRPTVIQFPQPPPLPLTHL